MNDRVRCNIRPAGLGIIIIQLSFLLAMRRPVTAIVANADNLVYDFKRIFKIPDAQLIVEQGTDGYPDLESDELCTYAPYFSSDTVTLFGKDFDTARKKKPCVALAMHHGSGLGEDLPLKGMPFNKFATANEYRQIFDMLTSAGYDVIVMNRADVDVEQKIFLINELCEFVVGYEGGIAQLAHILKVPAIILPWKYNDMGHAPVYPGILYEPHRYHVDSKTYFLNSVDEFLNLSKHDLDHLVERLHNDGGNNILFDPKVTLNPDTLEIHTANGLNLTPRICWCETRGAYTTEFIKTYLPIENMVKYRLKSTT
jgi:hypothetical protein